MIPWFLVGFDRDTDRIADRYLIPAEFIPDIKKIALYTDDPRDIGDAKLSPFQAAAIAAIIGEKAVDPVTRNYFLSTD